jgi:peptide/nickel transport system permease protein
MSGGRRFWRRFRRRRASVLGLALLGAVLFMAAAADWLYPGDPWDMAAPPLLWPGEDRAFPLGSDTLGRDIAAGLFHGARASLLIGAAATVAALALGTAIGGAAGYAGGRTDAVLMAMTELVQTLPPFLFAVVLIAILGPRIATIVGALAAISWPAVARLVRGEVRRLREREFVQSCIAQGMGHKRILIRHILPNALPPVIVMVSVLVASAILTEAGLAFLGLGDPNVLTWGTMIGLGRDTIRTEWYMAAIPGCAILVTVLGLNLVGDGLNDALAPAATEGGPA